MIIKPPKPGLGFGILGFGILGFGLAWLGCGNEPPNMNNLKQKKKFISAPTFDAFFIICVKVFKKFNGILTLFYTIIKDKTTSSWNFKETYLGKL